MQNEFNFKKCAKCGALVEVLKDCTCENCGIVCCGEKLVDVELNSKDFSVEKHLPEWEVKDNTIFVTVNHVMEEDHYIEWISLQTTSGNQRKLLSPGMKPEACFALCEGDEIEAVFAYCNLHSLWKSE